MAETKTLVIDNFTGRLTRLNTGKLNSGYAKYSTTFGNDPFTNPTNLTWFESATRIDPTESVITDLIVATKTRLESGITYAYAIGHTGRFYKIQVNNPSTFNPNYDNPVLITTLTINSPTFKFGSSINFFGSTQMVYIGHDKGATKINFDGTGEAEVGAVASWTANVPRPGVQFGASLYYGNGVNLTEVIAGGTVATYTKLSPGLPVGTQIRDLDVSPDGNYIQIVVSRIPAPDMTTTVQDTTSLSSADSYRFLWNGTDASTTSYESYNSYSINSNISFGPYSYTMGYDLANTAIYTKGQKIITLTNSISPNFNSLFSTGNLMGFASPEEDMGALKCSLIVFGQYDREIPEGLFRFLRASATGGLTDVIQVPMCTIVSNLLYGASSSSYAGDIVGSAKLYFSTLETDSTPTTKYKLYKFTTVPTGLGTSIGGVYETQTELFSKKVKLSEVRIYTEPLITGNSFKIELIGSDNNSITGSAKTFVAGSTNTLGNDYLWYKPEINPTYAIGIRITNLGTTNMVINKCEIDITEGGK